MPTSFENSSPSPSAVVRARLDYPVIDTDVHTNDYTPAVEDYVASYAGAGIALNTPEEGIAELEFAVNKLGLEAINIAGSVRRPIRALADKGHRRRVRSEGAAAAQARPLNSAAEQAPASSAAS